MLTRLMSSTRLFLRNESDLTYDIFWVENRASNWISDLSLFDDCCLIGMTGGLEWGM